jgi:hypothetical protein
MASTDINSIMNIRRLFPAAAAAVAFLAMAALLYCGETGAFSSIMRYWGFNPTEFLFLDTETIMSALRCQRDGVDVFVTNPCDPLGRVFDYSPLWLAAVTLPVTPAWTTAVGLAFDLAFLASLLLFPAGRTPLGVMIITVAALATPSAFALERGNCDLIIFALSCCGAALASRRVIAQVVPPAAGRESTGMCGKLTR